MANKKLKTRFPWYDSAFGHVRFTLVCDKKQLKECWGDDSVAFVGDDGGHGRTNVRNNDDATYCTVQINTKLKFSKNAILALIVHEAVHVYQASIQRMGESEPSSEFEAYQIQDISQRLFGLYEEYLSRSRKKSK